MWLTVGREAAAERGALVVRAPSIALCDGCAAEFTCDNAGALRAALSGTCTPLLATDCEFIIALRDIALNAPG